jgi:hypothetical protein
VTLAFHVAGIAVHDLDDSIAFRSGLYADVSYAVALKVGGLAHSRASRRW